MAYFAAYRTTLAAWALMLICTAAGAVGVPLGSVSGKPCGVGSSALTKVYSIHANHLNTPRVLLDEQGRTSQVYKDEPFGVSAPQENPLGLGAMVVDALRSAYWRKKPSPGLLHYSDRGIQVLQ